MSSSVLSGRLEGTAPCETADGVDVDVKIERVVKEADAGSTMRRCRCDGGWRGVKRMLSSAEFTIPAIDSAGAGMLTDGQIFCRSRKREAIAGEPFCLAVEGAEE